MPHILTIVCQTFSEHYSKAFNNKLNRNGQESASMHSKYAVPKVQKLAKIEIQTGGSAVKDSTAETKCGTV